MFERFFKRESEIDIELDPSEKEVDIELKE